MQFTQKECILMSLLECGSADLEMLEDIGYDLDDILSDLVENDCLSFNSLYTAIFIKGISELSQAVENRKKELEEDNKTNSVEYGKLRKLNPEEDIEYFCNCLDTHIYFIKNQGVYRKYFSDVINTVEDNMGIDFE